jgi:hypothetical protein
MKKAYPWREVTGIWGTAVLNGTPMPEVTATIMYSEMGRYWLVKLSDGGHHVTYSKALAVTYCEDYNIKVLEAVKT